MTKQRKGIKKDMLLIGALLLTGIIIAAGVCIFSGRGQTVLNGGDHRRSAQRCVFGC